MTYLTKPLIAAALALPLASVPVQAASKTPSTNARIEALEQQLEALKSQLSDLKKEAEDQKAEAQQQYAEVKNQYKEVSRARKEAVKATVKNGAPMLSSADGRFTAKISANLQSDFAYYSQDKSSQTAASGADLSSGAKVRRAQIGLSGKAFGDWSYNFLYDFAGSGTILYAYGQYNGLKPFAVRFGALLPSYGIEDQTGSTQLMFLERNSVANISRGIAGSESRMGLQAFYAGDRFFGSLAWTMGKASPSTEYDQQQALVARAAYLVVDNDSVDAHWMVNAGVQHVFKLSDDAAGDGTTPSIRLKDMPEIKVDASGSYLIDTGALEANHVTEWTLGSAANYQNFYLQGEYNRISVDRNDVSKNNTFDGWYLQGSWILTGESKKYSKGRASFLKPVPAHPFDLSKGDWGAWELAARYSDSDLNSDHGNAAAVYGGRQRNFTVGVNWYPNSTVRFDLDYMHIDVDKTNAALDNLGQTIEAVAMRAQVNF